MNIEELREYCISIKGSSESLPFIDPSILVFKVMNKVFAYTDLNPKDGIFKVNLKCNPEKSVELREQYHGITATYNIVTNRQWQKIYKFSSFNVNHSSGKKQGEISCFGIAYTLFADEEKISCLHFLLNDKKELVHDNQLKRIAGVVNQNDIQFVASILRDKLPAELNREEYFVVKLSQDDKLFRIENQ